MARLRCLLLAASLVEACSFSVLPSGPGVWTVHGRANAVSAAAPGSKSFATSLLAKDGRTDKDSPSADGTSQESGLLLKGAWVAAEALGNVAAAVSGRQETAPGDEIATGISREKLMERLRAEYENEYFISGEMDLGIYEDDCLFADPFASFRGKQRFKQNLANLGLFVSESECRLISLETDEEDEQKSIKSRVMVKLQLKLPWKPVLAWPWGVKYVVNEESGLISEHIESWEIDAGAGVAQVFRPGPPNGLAKSKE